jgi:zeaxanthin glucosyltransferase
MHFGLIVQTFESHLIPLLSLAAELKQRHHQVSFFAAPGSIAAGQSAGLNIIDCAALKIPLNPQDHLTKQYDKKNNTSQEKVLDTKTLESKYETYLLAVSSWLTHNPNTLDCLLVDAFNPFLYILGEKHHIPYILLDISIPSLFSSELPPLSQTWSYSDSLVDKVRNRLINTLYRFMIWLLSGDQKIQNKYADLWGLPRSQEWGDSRKALALISQVPEVFEFPRRDKNRYIYTGPWINPARRIQFDFPWERLSGQPLIYSALGTLFNDQTDVYTIIINACSMVNCQLVLSVGPVIPDTVLENFQRSYPQFIFVRKAPQVELLQRATVFITHAGTNSVLEALQAGVPMVAIPLGNDHPTIAARICYYKVGVSVPRKKLNLERLHQALQEVLNNIKFYRDKALGFRKFIEKNPGLTLGAETIERLMASYQLKAGY